MYTLKLLQTAGDTAAYRKRIPFGCNDLVSSGVVEVIAFKIMNS